MGYTKADKTSQDFLETAKEEFMFIASEIQNASEPLTLEAICELSDIAERGKTALEAAINIAIDKAPLP